MDTLEQKKIKNGKNERTTQKSVLQKVLKKFVLLSFSKLARIVPKLYISTKNPINI
jgi:hypothetical protein